MTCEERGVEEGDCGNGQSTPQQFETGEWQFDWESAELPSAQFCLTPRLIIHVALEARELPTALTISREEALGFCRFSVVRWAKANLDALQTR